MRFPQKSHQSIIVGPLPKAKGGLEYLLTCVDQASRWPEAIPLKKATSSIIIAKLTEIFCHVGFPGTIVTDNGSQFVSKAFKSFCTNKGIFLKRTALYVPQGNGVVERFHGTLKPMIQKIAEKKGNWPEVIQMALYFMRLTPSKATGVSPFRLMHGREPHTPLKLLYKLWVQNELGGDLDLEEWIFQNNGQIQALRDMAVIRQTEEARRRKVEYDKKAQEREFKVGDLVLYRVPGLDTKLTDSWSGPFEVVQVLSPLRYRIELDNGKAREVSIRFLKEYLERPVKRATTVLLEDREGDSVLDCNREIVLDSSVLDKDKQTDIDRWKNEFKDILTEEPGLTGWVSFAIDTRGHEPVAQRAYSTPVALQEGVGKEIGWLLQKGYIRESTSEWSSPIVAVPKLNGSVRVCVDFKKVNELTQSIPFYMPRIKEVLEAVGQAPVISKMDLAKGYNQVPMLEEDIGKTAFVCFKGKYEFLRMPFGVKNAPAVFQELMRKVLEPCDAFAKPYLDDIIIFSSSWQEHVGHVRAVLERLRQAGLTANPNKCLWGAQFVAFLGYRIGNGRLMVHEKRCEAVRNYQRPTSKKGLRSFLGLVSFYRRYQNMLAEKTKVLSPATAKAVPNRVGWTPEREQAFSDIHELISHECVLTIPVPEDSFSVITDASCRGIGGV